MSCTVWNSVFEPSPPKPSILFLVSDTTRASAFQKADTPNLDRLADAKQGQAVQFAIAPSSWTSPSVLVDVYRTDCPRTWLGLSHSSRMMRYKMEYPAISEDTQTLAEVLKEADYATHGFFANRFLIRDLGFSRGLINGNS